MRFLLMMTDIGVVFMAYLFVRRSQSGLFIALKKMILNQSSECFKVAFNVNSRYTLKQLQPDKRINN